MESGDESGGELTEYIQCGEGKGKEKRGHVASIIIIITIIIINKSVVVQYINIDRTWDITERDGYIYA
jgi:hypothetical protein